ncbi:sugar phosphate isomerase/epimerase family protein [Falsiroseomonas sp. HW251]|uniref:sugar phosphate isomerase/epimerase family protein n=1 Tax=Falsiroseomonas sp. HW251 TaxID=3390998 RepID=UPI003D320073
MTGFSLAHLTALSLPPPELVRVAARTGYRSVGLRLLRVTPDSPGHPLQDDPAALRETRRALAETGLSVLDIEFVRITPDLDVAALDSFVATGAALGARFVIAAPYDPDRARLADGFGALCDLAARYGMAALLEFFPYAAVRDLPGAAAIVEEAGRGNGGILVDTLHFDRSLGTPAQIAAIDPARFPMAHVCDAPAERPATTEGLLHHARAERLPPGEGGIEIKGVLDALPPGIPIALEVPMEAMARALGAEAVALRVGEAADRLLHP